MLMKKMHWKKDKLFSLKLRNGAYVLAQLAESPYIVFFNIFRNDDQWDDLILKETDVLFCVPVIKQFINTNIKCENIREVKGAKPLAYTLPRVWLRTAGSKEFTLWPDTPNEISFPFHTKYEIVEKDMYEQEKNTINGLYTKIIKNLFSEEHQTPETYKEIEGYQHTYLCGYPSLNERLYLCHLFSKSVNPVLEMEFQPDAMPIEYKNFFILQSGGHGKTVDEYAEIVADLGYGTPRFK